MDEYCPSTLRFVLSIPLISLESMGITFLISSNFNSAFKFALIFGSLSNSSALKDIAKVEFKNDRFNCSKLTSNKSKLDPPG